MVNNYTLGLDIGITSVGACAIDQDNVKLIELSVRRFDEAKEAKEARLNRSARRTLRRKKWRKEQLLSAFNDFGIISTEEIEKYGRSNYLDFYGKKLDLKVPDVYTVYHLRKKALSEKVSKRELLLCLYNILQARGHFLLDSIDFSKDGLSFDIFRGKMLEVLNQYAEMIPDTGEFEEKVLKKVFSANIHLNDLKKVLKDNRFTEDDDSEKNVCDICLIVAGGKTKIGRFYNEPDENAVNIETLKKKDIQNEFQSDLIELYDICRISKILKDGNQYVCDIAVEQIDKYRKFREGAIDEAAYKDWQSASKSKNHVRAYKNLNNSFPNGLYVKEVSAILHKQQEYYPQISDAFIEVCCSIASARIPYYVGPLGEHAKNAWANKKGKIKYNYDYTIQHFNEDSKIIDIEETIRTWKKNMVSHCTYLPEETALPKGSLIGEVFSIINEINNYNCKDQNENDYYLTREDKIKIIDELFLKKDSVSLEDVRKLLNLNDYYSVKGKTTRFNNKITIYKQLSGICEELKISSILDLFKNKGLINKIEDTILDINLFDEGQLKLDYFKKSFTEEEAKKLASVKSNGFYSFSKKFIFETPMNREGESMLDILFDDNVPEFRNNQQVIISGACDKDGNKLDFLSSKYEKIIRENNNKLSIDLILDKGKPLIPISRPVIRALNETFKVYNGYLDVYGVPSRVVVETAKGKDSIKDFTEQNGSPMRHYDKMQKLVNYLFEQLNEKDRNNAVLQGRIEEWEELESYYNSHKNEIELYIRQDGMDLLTGKRIDITRLEDYEIDHILPRGFGDDSQDDKMLISKLVNGIKGDRLPIEFLESSDAYNCGAVTVGTFEKTVSKLAEMKMISDKKRERLLLKNQGEAEGFINQNLVDTRYIISQFVAMLNAFNKVNHYNTHVVCMNSSFTDLYRKELGFKKDRDLGDQHHAYDAACICIADKCLNEYFPNYDRRSGATSQKGSYSGFRKYNEFVSELNESRYVQSNDSRSKIKRFIAYAFKKAYGQDIYKHHKEAPLLEEIKSRTPLLSWKVEKNYDGKLFDATLYKPKGEGDKSVLTVLGVNNEKRSFETVYPVAVDFYKINHKHYAIHIPLAIIEKDGTINKEKYIRLIKEHFKAPELLDENGEINLKAYRFRAFKHDMIYDTQANECYLFNLGSIANKKMEICPLNIYSYSLIYHFSDQIRINLTSRFNIKTAKNKDGVDFDGIDKKLIMSYMCDELGILFNPEKHRDRLYSLTEKIDNLNSFCNRISYFSTVANQLYMPPMFDKRILPVANNDIISKKPDAEYIKLKYHILGVRFHNNGQGTLIVNGPSDFKNGGFKKIKKEEFHWTISRNMIK